MTLFIEIVVLHHNKLKSAHYWKTLTNKENNSKKNS